MQFVDEFKIVFFFDGVKLTNNEVLELIEELFQQDGIFFLMTRALNQDKLENAFAVFRQKGGNNVNPSVAEINNILARLLSTKIVKISSNSNCEDVIDDTYDIVSQIIAEDLTENENIIEAENVENDQVQTVDETSEKAMDNIIDDFEITDEIGTDTVSLRYFLGYVAYKINRKLSCEHCAGEIIKEGEKLTSPSELFIFHKNYSTLTDFGALVPPSDSFFNVSKIHVSIFNHIFSQEPHCNKIKEKIVDKCIVETPIWFETCREHKKKILDFMILVLLRKHCLWTTKEKTSNSNKKLKIINN